MRQLPFWCGKCRGCIICHLLVNKMPKNLIFKLLHLFDICPHKFLLPCPMPTDLTNFFSCPGFRRSNWSWRWVAAADGLGVALLRVGFILKFNICFASRHSTYFDVFKFVPICNFPHWMYFDKAMTCCNDDPPLILNAYIVQARIQGIVCQNSLKMGENKLKLPVNTVSRVNFISDLLECLCTNTSFGIRTYIPHWESSSGIWVFQMI